MGRNANTSTHAKLFTGLRFSVMIITIVPSMVMAYIV